MKTAASNKKVRELISLVKDGKITPRPEFQRRLVWSAQDKNFFLDSVISGYPFPEIYVADGDVNLDTGEGTQLLVDGLQRVTTLVQYFAGDADLKLLTVPSYKDLTEDQKREFLQYDVAVRDLGAIPRDKIVEVFRRINSTKYSLEDIEINNAVYSGAIKTFAQNFADYPIFSENRIFSSLDYKRMGDLRFALSIIATMMMGYFNRDDELEAVLQANNDVFMTQQDISKRIDRVVAFIEECGFPPKSRVWRKADFFTLFIELDSLFEARNDLEPRIVEEQLSSFYNTVDDQRLDQSVAGGIYYKAAIQASNDRLNRIRRGVIIESKLKQWSDEDLLAELHAAQLI